jgi:Fe-S cluster assembly iron-binding protein IscA
MHPRMTSNKHCHHSRAKSRIKTAKEQTDVCLGMSVKNQGCQILLIQHTKTEKIYQKDHRIYQ